MTAYHCVFLTGPAYEDLLQVEMQRGTWCDVDGKRWVMLEGYALDSRGEWHESRESALQAAAAELELRAQTLLLRARQCREQAANQEEVTNV
jgi:hypothetical protein